MRRELLRVVVMVPLLAPWTLGGCEEPPTPPTVAEADIPDSRTIVLDYDERRLHVSGATPMTDQEERTVLAVSRGGMARYLEARSVLGQEPGDGRFRGEVRLHQGWRVEFFPLSRQGYEGTYPLPGGALFFEPTPTGLYNDIGKGWMMRGRPDWFTGLLNTVLDLTTDGVLTLGVETDDGSIGVLQDLGGDPHELRVLWYDWVPRGMTGHPKEISVPVTSGTYLLTVHYFEDWGDAGYQISALWRPAVDGVGP